MLSFTPGDAGAAADRCQSTGQVPVSADWLRLARALSWITLAWMGIEGGPARFRPGQRHRGHGVHHRDLAVHRHPAGQRHGRAASAADGGGRLLPACPYIAVDAVRALVAGDRAETSIAGLVLTAGMAIFEPALGVAKRPIGARLGSSATAGEGIQNLLCAYLAMAVFAGLAANTLWGRLVA